MNRLVLHRARGAYGPFYQPIPGGLIKPVGNWWGVGSPGSGITSPRATLPYGSMFSGVPSNGCGCGPASSDNQTKLIDAIQRGAF